MQIPHAMTSNPLIHHMHIPRWQLGLGLSLSLGLIILAPLCWAHPESDPGSCHFHTRSAEQHCAPEAGKAAPGDDSAVVQPLLELDEDSLPEVVAIPDNDDVAPPAATDAQEPSTDTVDQFQQLEARTAMIASIQGGLMRLGYSPGPATGMMNAGTEVAIRAFQSDQLLPVSGQPSLSLLTIIEDELKSRQRH